MKRAYRNITVISLVITMLISCEDKNVEVDKPDEVAIKDEGKKAVDPQETIEVPWSDKVKQMAWVRSGKEVAENYSEGAREALSKVDVKSLKSQAEGIKEAISREDFDSAQKYADKLDGLMESKVIGSTVRFLGIKSKAGVKDAQEAIKQHLDNVNLTPEEKKFFEDLHSSIASIDADQSINIIAFAAGIACDIKFGHGGVRTAYMVDEILRYAFGVKRSNPDDKSVFDYP